MARDGGIGNVGQAEFAEDALLFLLRLFGQLAGRKKPAQREFQNLFARDGGLQRAADQRRARARRP